MMQAPATGARRADWRLISLLLVAGVVALVVAANAHLVWVAVTSQPDCVVQTDSMGEAGLQPARRAC
ncbi:MAG TPA: hypothetical protein PLE81_03265 [Brevundimonas sp.]|uniref:hypothetical protein n=1 Tax=Brevundimonas sp. TaxID=1871086 RepID=UPI002C718B94|nr:hypothetical protein [Brevundimonas sp.]HRH19638.1 hypothetical protein [Brevundimonas sp.]